jgi:hypothetical protein
MLDAAFEAAETVACADECAHPSKVKSESQR